MRKRTPAQVKADKLRTGRPLKPPEEKRSERVMVYLKKSERERLERLAEKRGLSLASLIMSPWRPWRRK